MNNEEVNLGIDTEEKPKKKRKKDKAVSLRSKIEDKGVKMLNQLVDTSNRSRKENVAKWDRYYKKYRRGEQYGTDYSSGVPLYYTNYIFSNIEVIKANMLRAFPHLVVQPQGGADDLAAMIIDQCLKQDMEKADVKGETQEVLHFALLATMGIFKVTYDDEKDISVVNSISPYHLYIDPRAMNEEDARWIGDKECSVPVEVIEARYGKLPKEYDSDKDIAPSTREDSDDFEISPNTDYDENEPYNNVTQDYDVYELWVRVHETDRENDWYRYIFTEHTILEEGWGMYNHNKSPYVIWYDVKDPMSANAYNRGIGEISEIEVLQDRDDALTNKIYKHINQMVNRLKLVWRESGITTSDLVNVNQVLETKVQPDKAVFHVDAPQLGNEIHAFKDATSYLIQTVSGVFDVTQGRRPVGISAGRAIDSLKDSADTRLASKADNYHKVLVRVAQLFLANMFQFKSKDFWVRATDSDEIPEYRVVPDYPPQLQPGEQPMYDETGQLVTDTEGQDINEELEVSPELEEQRNEWKKKNKIALVMSEVSPEWDIKVSTDSALPEDKRELVQTTLDLFRLGAVDRKALLELLDFPDRHAILSRLEGAVTGRDAGDEKAEQGQGMVQGILASVQELLKNAGIPEQDIQVLIEAIMEQAQGGSSGGQQGLPYAPQGQPTTNPR